MSARSHGDLLRELTLPGDVTNPCHAIQLTNGQFVVCHGLGNDPLNRVCMISADKPASDVVVTDVTIRTSSCVN